MSNQTFTITFGDQAENHVGMQKLGVLAQEGFNYKDLEIAKKWFEEKGAKTKLIHLNSVLEKNIKTDDAYILIIDNGLDFVIGPKYNSQEFFNEQNNLLWDEKSLMYGRVVNKKARHNLCYSNEKQSPDYENGKGRIISFDDVPLLNILRNLLPLIIGNKANELMVEGNNYYDINKCGIGFHGDSERKKVIGLRVGAKLPLHFQWFHKSKPVGNKIEFILNTGDIYFMSEKATGNDWKKKNIYTLRHAAGCQKFLTIK